MVETVYARVYYAPQDARDFDAGGCPGGTISRNRKGRSGSRRHWCIRADSGNLRYDSSGSGHNPCRGLGGASLIGGGVNGGGGQNDFTGRSRNFSNAPAALKCTNVNVTDGNLRSWSGSDHMLRGGAIDDSGTFKSLYTQTLFGISTSAGGTRGYCSELSNLNKVVHRDGKTCYDMLSNAVQQKAQGIQFCKQNPRDPKCKCINVAGAGFIDYCKKNPTLPGCNEVVKGISDFEKAGLKSATGLFGNADCIVPNVCSGDVFQPLSPVPACANKTAICNQILELDNVQAAAGIQAAQACNINFEAEQKKKDEAKIAEEQKKQEEAAKAVQTKLAEAPTTPSQMVPSIGTATSSKLPGGITGLQAGIGGGILSFILSCSSIIILLIVMSMGSKRRR